MVRRGPFVELAWNEPLCRLNDVKDISPWHFPLTFIRIFLQYIRTYM